MSHAYWVICTDFVIGCSCLHWLLK